MKTLEEAKEVFFARFKAEQRTAVEEISTEDSQGRVTAEPIFANMSAPFYHSAAMDGIVVRAEATYGTTETHPKTLEIGKDALWINTGQAIPEGFDAVIMVEKLHQLNEEEVEIRSPAYPWQHIRKVGEDIVATQLLLPQNHSIRPYDMGSLISAGIFSFKVWKKPRVVIIPTGSELVPHKEIRDPGQLKKGQIIEYNSLILAGLVRECHGIPIIYDIVSDLEEKIREAMKRAVDSEADLIIVNAGSSAGSKDYTANIIGELGEVLVHGVAMMPGKPTILGVVEGKPVIGNPGYAVSATLSFEQFIRPLIYSLQTPLPRAAGSITTLTRAEGILRIPALSEGVMQNEEMEAELLVDEEEILNTVVVIGSHDITIDVLADEIRRRGHSIRISSGNVGSLGGLMALRKGTCHVAGSHLLDTETGEYNIAYVKRYLKGISMSIFHLVLRDQGLILARGNPKGIGSIHDLTREDVTFVNRQAGSGTRVLFDYKLEQLGVMPEGIKGYGHEEFTHMAVAVDVLSGAADCGLGIFAAAKALKLDFIPIEKEQYDLIIPSSILENRNIQSILDTIESRSFKDRVIELGGYDPSKSGQFWMEVG
jgi:putative molybdopterin biosynthesis protein